MTLLRLYLASWLVLIWSALCVSAGAALMFLALVASLEAHGLHVAGPVAKAVLEMRR